MSDALPLPPRPNLEQYKKLVQQACKSSNADAVRDWAARWVETLARLGLAITPEVQRQIDADAERLEQRDGDEDQRRSETKMWSDSRMSGALHGEILS